MSTGLIIGKGLSYAEIIEKDIFEPLGLGHCTFRLNDDQRRYAVVPNDTSSWNIDTDAGIFNPSVSNSNDI